MECHEDYKIHKNAKAEEQTMNLYEWNWKFQLDLYYCLKTELF